LKELDEQRKLEFLTLPGSHMQIPDDVLIEMLVQYFGPVAADSVIVGKKESTAHPNLVLQGQ
jgi:hypothetical protein